MRGAMEGGHGSGEMSRAGATDRLLDRWKRITVTECSPGRLAFAASLDDDAHQMELELLVEESTGRVLSARGQMPRVPYHDRCRAALPVLDRLVGHHIGPGSTKEVFRLVGGPGGCTHVAELVIDAFRAYVPSIGAKAIRQWRDELTRDGCPADLLERKVQENVEAMGRAILPDTCVVYATNKVPASGAVDSSPVSGSGTGR